MKWIGQHIWDQISRFRDDVYLENVSESAQDHVVGIDANGKLYKQDVSAGDITGVTITTDSGGGSAASDTEGSADFSILGTSGVGVTNSGTTITVTSVPGEIDHDSLLNFASNEHFTQANITTVGTIDTGVWNGTVIASSYLDADTAHLTTNQTFTGVKTFSNSIVFDGDANFNGEGSAIHVDATTITDTNTSASGTAARYQTVNIEGQTLAATNASVTTTDAASLRIMSPPSAGTNMTITNPYSLLVVAGNTKLGGDLTVNGNITGKQYRIINTSFRDDIGTTKHYLPLKSQDEQTALTREEGTELAVCDGRVVSITYRAEQFGDHSGDATVTFGIETNTVGSSYSGGFSEVETEAITVNDADDQHLWHVVFSNAKHWDSTDMFAISIVASEDITGSNERHFITVVIEDDWSTYLGIANTSTTEIDTTP